MAHPLLAVCAIALTVFFALPKGWYRDDAAPRVPAHATTPVSADEGDALLQEAAGRALGGREGAVIVLDAQTGRVRALVNPRLAAEEAFAPGSTIKPFAALAALRSHLVGKDSRLLCREPYRRKGFHINCTHPKEQPPFDLEHALAFSCNYYFGELGERLSEEAFNRTLVSFGFGAPTGFAGGEATGTLPRSARAMSNALGEGGELTATPMQVASAYAALGNGGQLFAPRRARAAGFQQELRARLEVAPAHREVLLEGMRGAVEYGTAEGSGLAGLPLRIFGKTGTATANDSARTQGWFVGFAADASIEKVAAPAAVKLVVLVLLKRAHGAESAAASREIFAEFARMGSRGETEARGRGDNEQVAVPVRLAHAPGGRTVRVHMVREKLTRTISFEEYVLGVVAAEGSIEDEPEALKALAVASRTYALKNLRRHARDDYDFCTLTHCQRYFAVSRSEARESFVRAVAETSGEVLRDGDDRIVEAYFSAACGGVTADISTLWGTQPKSYLRGTRDDYCAEMPHRHWTDVIPAERLVEALRSDPRSDVGARLTDIRVVKRDVTGRAELMELTGEHKRTLRGWDFKLIVGRSLGWNLLKSSRFEVSRRGTDFLFRGSGFGHGLGLCQEGAHVMAAGGMDYRQILARYFPGTRLRRDTRMGTRA